MNSCTRSRNSVKSSVFGGTNPRGCLLDAERLVASTYRFCLEKPIWRTAFVKARGICTEDILTAYIRCYGRPRKAFFTLPQFYFSSSRFGRLSTAGRRGPRNPQTTLGLNEQMITWTILNQTTENYEKGITRRLAC